MPEHYGDIPFEEKKKRTLLGTLGDVGVTGLKSAVGLGESIVGLANLATPGFDVGSFAKKYAGYDPERTQETLSDLYSPAQKEDFKNVEEAEGILPTAEALLRNPSTIAHTALEVAPQLIGGAGFGKAALSAIPKLAKKVPSLISKIGHRSVLPAGSAAEETRQETGTLTPGQSLESVGRGVVEGAGTFGRIKAGNVLRIPTAGRLAGGATLATGTKGRKEKAVTPLLNTDDDLAFS